MRVLILASLALTIMARQAVSADTATPFTYKMFEESVPHLDVEVCPKALQGSNRFCRVSLANDALHVYAFSTDGDQPLLGFQSYTKDKYELLFKD